MSKTMTQTRAAQIIATLTPAPTTPALTERALIAWLESQARDHRRTLDQCEDTDRDDRTSAAHLADYADAHEDDEAAELAATIAAANAMIDRASERAGYTYGHAVWFTEQAGRILAVRRLLDDARAASPIHKMQAEHLDRARPVNATDPSDWRRLGERYAEASPAQRAAFLATIRNAVQLPRYNDPFRGESADAAATRAALRLPPAWCALEGYFNRRAQTRRPSGLDDSWAGRRIADEAARFNARCFAEEVAAQIIRPTMEQAERADAAQVLREAGRKDLVEALDLDRGAREASDDARRNARRIAAADSPAAVLWTDDEGLRCGAAFRAQGPYIALEEDALWFVARLDLAAAQVERQRKQWGALGAMIRANQGILPSYKALAEIKGEYEHSPNAAEAIKAALTAHGLRLERGHIRRAAAPK